MVKNTLMDNEYANKFFHDEKKVKSTFGDGFVGMHSDLKKDMVKTKAQRLFPSIDEFQFSSKGDKRW